MLTVLHGCAKLRAGAKGDGFHVKTWDNTPALHMVLSTVRHNFIASLNLSKTFPEHMETTKRPFFSFIESVSLLAKSDEHVVLFL